MNCRQNPLREEAILPSRVALYLQDAVEFAEAEIAIELRIAEYTGDADPWEPIDHVTRLRETLGI
jgi:hypothetical protein